MSGADLADALRRRVATYPKLGYRVKFLFDEGGSVYWDGSGDQAEVVGTDAEDDREADTILRLTEENFARLLDGTLDPTLAYMTGKLKVEGKLGVALKINGMLSD
jgi:putative sterol carrier protein